MEESMKGAFTTTESDVKNKTLSKDDEIENDFMTSWKITNKIDEMDFTSETSSLAGKHNFDFDKLDDFEFGDFGKMSSFKIDMSNLDFSSPQRKKEKGKEISDKDPVNEQRNGKQGVFSFNFDFNELEGFGLDANLMKGEKNFDNITTKKKLDYCDKIAIDHDSKSKSGTCISDREKDLKGINKLDNATSDVSGDMISHVDVDVACNSAPTAFKNNCTTNIFPVDQKVTTADQGNKAKDMQKVEHKEQSKISVDEKLNAAMVPKVLFVQSTDKLAPGAPPENQIGSEVIDVQDRKADDKKNKNMESHGSHDSRNSTSENALNLQHATERCNSDASNEVALHYQCDASKNGPSDNRMNQIINGVNTSVPSVSIKPACLVENEDQHSLGPKTLPSLRSSNAQRTFLKGSFLKPLSGETKQSIQVLQKVSVSNILNAEVKEKTEQVFHRVSPSKPLNGELPRKRLTFFEDDKHNKENLISDTTKQTNACMNSRNSMAKLGALAHIRSPKANSIKSNGLSTVTNDARYAISRFSSNTNMPNISNQKRSNFKSLSDINAVTNLGKGPKLVSTESTERHATLIPSLKRKSYEGSIAELASLRSSKRSSESPTGKSCAVDTSPRTNVQMVLNSECRKDTSPVPQSSSFDIPPVTSIMDTDVSLIMEDDGNVRKAEACTKELEEICSMLKKKQEEAKELVVRAVVNNNFLLMLNHPVHEEKIRKLQKFASSLLSKDYNF